MWKWWILVLWLGYDIGHSWLFKKGKLSARAWPHHRRPLNLGTNFTYRGSRAKCQREANVRPTTKVNSYVVRCQWRYVYSRNWEQPCWQLARKQGPRSNRQEKTNPAKLLSLEGDSCLGLQVRIESCWPRHLDFSLLSPWAEKPVHMPDFWPTDWDNADWTNQFLLF